LLHVGSTYLAEHPVCLGTLKHKIQARGEHPGGLGANDSQVGAGTDADSDAHSTLGTVQERVQLEVARPAVHATFSGRSHNAR